MNWLADTVIGRLDHGITDAYPAAVEAGDLKALPEANVITP